MKLKKILKKCLLFGSFILVLSITNMQAWVSNPPSWVTDDSKCPIKPLLPDPLINLENGTQITNMVEWTAQRDRLKDKIKECITGTFPPIPSVSGSTSFSSGSSKYASFSVNGVSIGMTIYFPSGSSSDKYPVIILTWVGTGNASSAPGNGYVGVSLGTGEIGSLSGAFPGYTWGELMKRAWIAGAAAKWLKNQSWVDSNCIATSGHSRGGKVALWAAAMFDDITGGAPNCGGTAGESAFRFSSHEFNTEPIYGIDDGDGTGYIARICGPNLKYFSGRENRLPVDMNSIQALVAPRALILGTAVNDVGGNPFGVEQAYWSCKKVWDAPFINEGKKIGMYVRWCGHGYSSTDLSAYCQFLNYAWGRTSSTPSNQFINNFRYNYSFDKWKIANPTEQINLADYIKVYSTDMSDILKKENNLPITATNEWDQKKAQIKEQLQIFLGTGPVNGDSSLVPHMPSATGDFGATGDPLVGGEDDKPVNTSVMTRETIQINNYLGKKLFNCFYCRPNSGSNWPVFIYLNPTPYANGFSGINWGGATVYIQNFVNSLVGRGVAVIGFDMVGSGFRVDEGTKFYERYPKWSKMGKMVDDVRSLVNAINTNSKFSSVNKQKIYTFGYGFGGPIALYSAVLEDRIAGVVTLCGFSPMRTANASAEIVRRLSDMHGFMPKIGFFVNNENRLQIDYNEIIVCIAPRPVRVVTPLHDMNSALQEVRDTVTNARQVYTLFNRTTLMPDVDVPNTYSDTQFGTLNSPVGTAFDWIKNAWDGVELRGSTSATALLPNGSNTATITAEVRDRMGRKTNFSGSAVFSITSGSASGTFTTGTTVSISNGIATATLKATNTAGTVIVKIAVSGLNDYTLKIPVENPDTTAPGKITTLATGAVTYNSVVLTWNAVGDDGTTGTAVSYDIRYMVGTALTSGNWASAVQVNGEPNPKTAGSIETMTVNGLSGNAQYYIGIKAIDNGGLQSELSNVVSTTTSSPPPDPVLPAKINNLAAGNATKSSITLTWTATGDDGTTGSAIEYDIRYMEGTALSSVNWDGAVSVTGEPQPKSSGSAETMVIQNLKEDTLYYIGIKARDEILTNWSELSNIVNLKTTSDKPSGEWKFEEGTGTTAGDTSSNNNNGTLSGTALPVWETNGKIGKALKFDGNGGYVSATDNSSIDITNAITLEAWVKSEVVDQDGSTRRVIDKGATYALGASDKAYFKLYVGGVAKEALKTWSSGDANMWHHIVGTYDGTTMKLYQDGVEVANTSASGLISTNDNGLQIGRQSDTSGRFKGLIDEVRIYNRALTNVEIQNHFNPPPPPVDNPPTINITAPANNSVVSEVVAIEGTATDAEGGISKVCFYIDNVIKSTDTTAPYAYTLDTTQYTNGTHIIKAVATDTIAQTASTQITVTINNIGISLVPKVDYLSITKLERAELQLSWLAPIDANEITAYNIYMSTGEMDYTTAYKTVASTQTQVIISGLIANQEYKFVLRSVDTNGNEEKNTYIIADTAVEHVINGMGVVKVPQNGMDISGKKITLISESIDGDISNIKDITFEYRRSGDDNWITISVANPNHPNPDNTYPYFINWDVSELNSSYLYNVRAVATDKNGIRDTRTGYVTVGLDNEDPDIEETSNYKRDRIDNRRQNEIIMGEPNIDQICEVNVPDGVLSSSSTMIKIVINPMVSQTIGKSLELANGGNLILIGYIHNIYLESGQDKFSKEIEISLPYQDDNKDNRVDGTNIGSNRLIICSFDELIGKWQKVNGSTIDKVNKLVTCKTNHLSYYGVFAVLQSDLNTAHIYPNPYKPSIGHTSIIFTNLTNRTKAQIFNLAGDVVYEQEKDTPTGELIWDVKNAEGEPIASGVYMYMITNNAGQVKKGKLAIIRCPATESLARFRSFGAEKGKLAIIR